MLLSSSAHEESSPQGFWINSFQRKACSAYSPANYASPQEFKKSLLTDLAQAMEAFPVDKFRTDYYFLLIWLAYIRIQFELHGDEDDCRKMFKMMKSSHIGLHHPEFFLHWAAFELEVERRDKSLAVLASADDIPIMRENAQISSAKDRIGAGKSLNLDALYKINWNNNINGAQNSNSPSTTTTSSSMFASMTRSASQMTQPEFDVRTPSILKDLDEKLNQLKRSGVLGPPKRIKEAHDVASFENKENSKNNDGNSNTANIASAFKDNPFPAPIDKFTSNYAAEQSGNSNMSLTMTEFNVGTIETKASEGGGGSFLDSNSKNKGYNNSNNDNSMTIPAVNQQDTGTLNMTQAAAVELMVPTVKDGNGANTSGSTSDPNVTAAAIRSRQVRVNGKMYRVLQLIGRGGSSKVFRVINAEGNIYALKKVNLKNLDETTLNGYANEISLLKKFANNQHIIHMMDSEMNREQGYLYILMEYGEIDLGKLLKNRVEGGRIGEKLDLNFIRFAWQQMLMAVNTVHEAKIVHCDLKPANFLLVQGSLKLIDFGISKAILNDTTNIVRENQVGTVNYMSPEALQETSVTHDRGKLKIGRPSDIWSLGCILYEMSYGRPPFAHFTTLIQRLHKILDPGYEIEFPTSPHGDLIDTIKGCLRRPPKERYTLPHLANHQFLCPRAVRPDVALVSRNQIQVLLEKFAEAFPGINSNTASLADKIFQQWRQER